MSRKMITIVCPVFNEEGNIQPFHERVQSAIAPLRATYDFEILFTDNHSTDRTFAVLRELAAKDSAVRVLRFSRNFGYQKSIHTGYCNARGDAAVQLDVDLQDPPEMVAQFLEKWEAGYKVVYGVRKTRQEGPVIHALRKAFYRLIDLLSDERLPVDAGDFRLVDRLVIEQLRLIHDEQLYLRGLITLMGFEQLGIPYDRAARTVGTSKFMVRDLFRLAADALLNHSTFPLRLASYVGLLVSFVTMIGMAIYAIARLFFHADWPAGFATTTVLQLLGISLNALFLGIIGEYLRRIYVQAKQRPLTIIEQRLNG